MEAFLHPLQGLAEFGEIKKRCGANCGILNVSGCMESQKVHLMYGLSGLFPYHLILADDERNAKEIYEDYRFYDKNVYFYPAKDLLFFQADIHGNLLIRQRMRVIRALLEQEEVTVVTSIDGCMDFLMPLEKIRSRLLHFKSDSVIDLDQLKEELVELGYERTGQVELPGQFSVRGGIIDIYPLTEDNPWRIELWDDEVDSIRSFDAESQRSLENVDEITIYPAAEKMDGEDMVSFLDYFPEEKTLVFLDELNHLAENGEGVEEEYCQSRMHREEKGEANLPEQWLCGFQELQKKLNRRNCVAVSALSPRRSGWKINEEFDLTVKSVDSYNSSFELLTRDLKRLKRSGYRVVLLSGSRTRAKRLAEDLRDYDLSSFYSDDLERTVEPGEIMVSCGYVAEGYEYPMLKFMVISETDIFGRRKKKKRRRRYEGQKIRDFAELKPGDYVVHENHGIGIYQGIEKLEVEKTTRDYMKISYADNGVLYIPVAQMDLIQKYAGSDARKPKLNKLGTVQWGKTKSQVKKAVREVAEDLVKLYAARQHADGFVYGPDTVWQKEFEEMFPFEETEDQLQAIEDTKHDMESTKIMDRLICGDVGYGKTEIALRAAFKAVQEGKQVVYLVPTTILAQQHYNTFVQRLKDFPVRIDLMCRFRSSAQQKKTAEDLKKGLVDIVIGTHRVLSKDVGFKDLGLLIIDEEQRFGVAHKEKIKKLRENVDVLTLTATPIPRTLHMSLIGIRDMSVLEEAPQDRMPIQTYVIEYSDEVVREAIERELARGGQVYYVYNRVSDIADVAGRLARLLPDATVSYAHGQMRERQLEDIMYDFINGDIDVLVSTTIIETGLDIPNANTMIIQDADRFGLSQLYQLRGRVGRSNRMAYAFLLYRRDKLLQEVAEKRLSAIREFTDLGSGIKIAMRDLEIRGAGNLLGEAQSGHMEAVGYDLYCKMLNEAVLQLKGGEEAEIFQTTIDLNINAYIPDSYIRNENQKLDIYKRISAIENEEDMDDMTEELIDRFGDIPKTVQLLLHAAALKNLAHAAYVTAVEQKGDAIRFVMYERAKIDPAKIPALLASYGRDLLFRTEDPPCFLYRKAGKSGKAAQENVLDTVRRVLEDIRSLALP